MAVRQRVSPAPDGSDGRVPYDHCHNRDFGRTYTMQKVPSSDYCMEWPQGVSQIHKELYGYVHAGEDGFLSKPEHCMNAMMLQWPKGEVEWEAEGVVNEDFVRLIEFLCSNHDLGVAGSASSGKTYPIAAWTLVDWWAAPHCTTTFVCTTSLGASEDRIWGKIRKLHKLAAHRFGTVVDHKHMIVFGKVDETSARDREYDNAIKFVPIEPGSEGSKALETLRGRKNDRVRLIVDELAEMDRNILDSRLNLAANPDFTFIGIGNPKDYEDAHGELCRPDDALGYEAITKDTGSWQTRTGSAIHIRGDKNPNFTSGKILFPYLLTPAKVDKIRKACYGNENTVEFLRNVIGFWAGDSVQSTVLTKKLINDNCQTPEGGVVWDIYAKTSVAGFDIGFTAGGDSCVLQFGILGKARNGKTLLVYSGEKRIVPDAGKVFEDAVAEKVVAECLAMKVLPQNLGVDVSMDGGKVMQAVIKAWMATDKSAIDIYAISSMGKASDRRLHESDKRLCSQVYDRKVTELWFSVRRAVMSKRFLGLHVDGLAAGQMCQRKYEAYGHDMVRIETKDDMKRRTRRSPDEADALAYMVEMARRAGFDLSPEDETPQSMTRRFSDDSGRKEQPGEEYGSADWGE